MNPHEITPTGVTVRKAQDKEITQLREAEYLRVQEAI